MDADETETPPDRSPEIGGTLSRRRAIQGAAVGAGALWITPAVMAFDASPAAASPGGCLICGSPIAINGVGTTLTGWTAPAGSTGWITTGTVFEATGGSGALRRRDRAVVNFSTECVDRFNRPVSVTNPQVTLTLAGRLRGNSFNTNPSLFTVTFYPLANLGGTALSTITLASTSATLPGTAASVVGNVPAGATSMRVRLDLFGSLLGNPGQARNLTVTGGAC